MRLGREDGVSAVIVAISLVAIFGAAVLSVDAGSVWKTRRDLITDTDGAAAAAALFMNRRNSASCVGAEAAARDEALGVLQQNNPESRLVDFKLEPYVGVGGVPDCRAGVAQVDAENDADLAFAGIFGFNNVDVFSSTSAQWGLLVSLKGKLWPIGICDETTHYIEWATIGQTDPTAYSLLPTLNPLEHPTYSGAGVVHRIRFEKVQNVGAAEACGDAPGNWDHLDYDGQDGDNGIPALRKRWEFGYDGEVWLDDSLTPEDEWDCNEVDSGKYGANDPCSPQTGGGGGSIDPALEKVKCVGATQACIEAGKAYFITVYHSLSGQGAQADYEHVAWVGVLLRGWSSPITGTPQPDNYFDFEFVFVPQTSGSIGVPSTTTIGPRGSQICGGNYGGTIDRNCAFPATS